jgi:PhnB protein
MSIQPYLMFDGVCEQALDFYAKAIGAKVGMKMLFKDSPDKNMCSPGNENKVMHSAFNVGDSLIMASDGRSTGNPVFQGFALSIAAKDAADAEKLFNALCEGGTVLMPLAKTFFAKSFGMVKDKFGVQWMVMAQ